MKEIAGWFWPDGQPEGWVCKLPQINGRAAYDRTIIDRAIALCRRRRVAIDGGAHVGLWSAPLLHAFGHVVAFEPHPDNVACLVSNCVSDRLTIYQTALSDSDGPAALHTGSGKSMCHSLETFRDAGGPSITVGTIALDALDLRDIDLIKLDLEGHEYAALQGARLTIERCRPVIVIEEKFDIQERASSFLESLGMVCNMRTKRDRLFIWK